MNEHHDSQLTYRLFIFVISQSGEHMSQKRVLVAQAIDDHSAYKFRNVTAQKRSYSQVKYYEKPFLYTFNAVLNCQNEKVFWSPTWARLLRVATAATSTTDCCKKRASFPLLSWLKRADGTRKIYNERWPSTDTIHFHRRTTPALDPWAFLEYANLDHLVPRHLKGCLSSLTGFMLHPIFHLYPIVFKIDAGIVENIANRFAQSAQEVLKCQELG
uniref:Uncharacterized protein n=1 Tax=Romanomermis culicivorax TaxID=13658 RepID=A0A915KPD4_ROMCU